MYFGNNAIHFLISPGPLNISLLLGNFFGSCFLNILTFWENIYRKSDSIFQKIILKVFPAHPLQKKGFSSYQTYQKLVPNLTCSF